MIFRTIASGNTFGSTRWSDGKVFHPMMPDEPWLRASRSENVMFWADECVQIGVLDRAPHPEWKRAEYAVEPSEEQYILALRTGLGTVPVRQFYLRQRLWWSGNDRRRHGQPSPPLEEVHRENLHALAKQFETNSTPDSLITRAEILRELSFFEASAALLDGVSFDENLGPIADRIFDEAEMRNPVVFALSSPPPVGAGSPGRRSSRRSPGGSRPHYAPGAPRSADDRRHFYSQPSVLEEALTVAETIGLGRFDSAVVARYLEPDARVLDAGCGVGRCALGLWQAGFRHIDACDFASAQVAAARTLLARHQAEISPAEWDFTSMPVADGHYDAVLCLGNTLDELFSQEERVAVVKEFARVVRPGGQFVFSLQCGVLQTELEHIIGSPRFVPTGEWTGGMVNRDIRYGEITVPEVKAFGPRCYHVSERIRT